VVAQLKAFAARTEAHRAHPGPLATGSAWRPQPLSRQGPSLPDDLDVDQPGQHDASVDLAGLPIVVVGGLASDPHILTPLRN
jgi:hypothetical protein